MEDNHRPKRRWTLAMIARWKSSITGPASTRIVGRHLAEAAEDDPSQEGKVQASIPQISRETGVAERTVRDSIRRLEKERRVKRNRIGGLPGEPRQQGNEIKLLLPEEGEEPTHNEPEHSDGPPSRAGPEKEKPERNNAPAGPGRTGVGLVSPAGRWTRAETSNQPRQPGEKTFTTPILP